jgi:hypothetical protein
MILSRSCLLILTSAALMAAEATPPVATPTDPATVAAPADGPGLPGFFQERISAAITGHDWPLTVSLLDGYLAVAHRAAPVRAEDGTSYRDVRTLEGFCQLIETAEKAQQGEGKADATGESDAHRLADDLVDARAMLTAAEQLRPLSQHDIDKIMELLDDTGARMHNAGFNPCTGEHPDVDAVSGSQYRKAVALALASDSGTWWRHHDTYTLPLPDPNPTPFSAIVLDNLDEAIFCFQDFTRKPTATGVVSATAPAPVSATRAGSAGP